MSYSNDQVAQKERISLIIDQLSQGVPRDIIAEQFGYKNWKCLDTYMRRHGYYWDRIRKAYLGAERDTSSKSDSTRFDTKSSPDDIIRLFSIGLLDAKQIAGKMGFAGHKEMGEYMRSHGYIWSSNAMNYILSPNSKSVDTPFKGSIDISLMDYNEIGSQSKVSSFETEKYEMLLDFLWQSRDQLVKLIESYNASHHVNLYNIPGQAKTKSIYLSDALSGLMRSFCEQHNITQKQGYEAALVEYLSARGYKEKVDQLLTSTDLK